MPIAANLQVPCFDTNLLINLQLSIFKWLPFSFLHPLRLVCLPDTFCQQLLPSRHTVGGGKCILAEPMTLPRFDHLCEHGQDEGDLI